MALLLLAAIFLGSPNFRPASVPDASPFGGDVLQEWIGGYIVRHGDYGRFYDVSYAQSLEHDEHLVGFAWRQGEYFPMVYPPFYYLLVAPLSWLPFSLAALLWAGLMVLAYLAAWRLFEKYALRAGKAAGPTAWLLPLSLLFMPLIENFTTCQKGSLLLLLLTATYYLLVTTRPYWAGLVFGLIAFKPQFALPIAIAMLCKQQWRFVLGGLTTGSMLVGLCAWMGLDVCSQYVDFSTHAGEYLRNAGYDLTKSHAWSGFFSLLRGSSPAMATMLVAAADVATVGVVALALRGPFDASSRRFPWQFSALTVATVLLSPHLYTYDLTVLLLPLGLVAAHARGVSFQPVREGHLLTRRLKAYATTRWLALLLFCLVGLSPKLAAITGIQLSVPLMFAFLWASKKAAGENAGGVYFAV
jgi:hypothetical protein